MFSSPTPPKGLTGPAQVREDRSDQMGGEPDILIAHVLIDVDQDQHPRKENAQDNVSPVGKGVGGIQSRKEQDENN